MNRLKIWQTTTAIVLVLMVWLSILAFPTSSGEYPRWARWATAAFAVALMLVGIGIWVATRGEGRRAPMHALAATLTIVGVIDIMFALAAPQGMTIDTKTKFAMGVGGAALAGFAYGLTQFDTMRAAASIPVVVLLVGVVVWPDAKAFVEPDVRQALITWMGVLLGINGAAEAAKQVATIRTAASPGDAGSAPGDLSSSP
jgi:hypothetical protein